MVFALDLDAALALHSAAAASVKKKEGKPEPQPDLTPGARTLASSPLRVDDLLTSPDGSKLAFLTNAINQRQEKYEDVELYTIDLQKEGRALSPAALTEPRRITNNQAEETQPRWANDSRHIFFSI